MAVPVQQSPQKVPPSIKEAHRTYKTKSADATAAAGKRVLADQNSGPRKSLFG